MLTAALPLLTVAVLLLTGLAASLLAFPAGTLSLPSRVASLFALGYSVVALLATLLVLAHLLIAWVMALALAAAWVAMLAPTLRRGHPARQLRRGLLAEASDGGWLLAFGAAAVVLIAVARAAVPVNTVAGGWRYWSDGLEIADVGHIPAHTLQWGALYEPAISKLAANAYNAALSFPLQSHPFSAMAASLWLSSVGLAAGLWALAWELRLRYASPLLPLLALTAHSWPAGVRLDAAIVHKLQFFQNEDAGRTCAVVAVALALPALRGEAGARRLVTCGAILAAASLTHLVPVVALSALLVSYAAAAAALLRRGLRPALGGAAVVLATALVVSVTALVAAGGDVGFQGASGGAYHPLAGRYDPTLALLGRRAPPRPKTERRFYTAPATMAADYLTSAVGPDWRRHETELLLAFLAALALALLAGGRAERLAATSAAAMALLLIGVALLFSFRYSYYVPATFGDRRLFEYGSIPLLLLAAAAVNALLGRLRGLDARLALAAAGALCAGVALIVGLGGVRAGLEPGQRPQSPLIEAARVAVPCGSRVLTPFMTRGSFQALTGRPSVREGLMVFLRPRILDHALAIQREAASFYRHPLAHARFLRRYQIDYVLAYAFRARRFSRLSSLVRAGAVDPVVVYRVTGASRDGAAMPREGPGYHCVTAPMR